MENAPVAVNSNQYGIIIILVAIALAWFIGSVAMLRGRPWIFSKNGRLGFFGVFSITYIAYFVYLDLSRYGLGTHLKTTGSGSTIHWDFEKPPITLFSKVTGPFILTAVIVALLALLSTDAAKRKINWLRTAGSIIVIPAWIYFVIEMWPDSKVDGPGSAIGILPFATLFGVLAGRLLEKRVLLRRRETIDSY